MIIHSKSYPRAGLVGNPSDGYFGKTISFIVRNFEAEVILYETPELKIQPARRDESVFGGIRELAEDVRQFGYYGGIRLLKATVKRFHDYCVEHDIELDDRNFTLRYKSNIPSQVGMAGSSAIITACLRALMTFYGVHIPKPIRPALILSVENDELGIPAGLQDRVIQAYEGLVYMDFSEGLMKGQGHGDYRQLDGEGIGQQNQPESQQQQRDKERYRLFFGDCTGHQWARVGARHCAVHLAVRQVVDNAAGGACQEGAQYEYQQQLQIRHPTGGNPQRPQGGPQ